AANPLTVLPKGLDKSANVLATTSFFAAVDPVAMAMWPGAVSEGVTVVLRRAATPLLFSNPIPWFAGRVPSPRNWSTIRGVAPASAMTMALAEAPAGMGAARGASAPIQPNSDSRASRRMAAHTNDNRFVTG